MQGGCWFWVLGCCKTVAGFKAVVVVVVVVMQVVVPLGIMRVGLAHMLTCAECCYMHVCSVCVLFNLCACVSLTVCLCLCTSGAAAQGDGRHQQADCAGSVSG